jgi:hypothetical protein
VRRERQRRVPGAAAKIEHVLGPAQAGRLDEGRQVSA